MAICPNCHQTDKNFFAPQCHNCNSVIPFMQQVGYSITYAVVSYGIMFGGMYLIYKAFT